MREPVPDGVDKPPATRPIPSADRNPDARTDGAAWPASVVLGGAWRHGGLEIKEPFR